MNAVIPRAPDSGRSYVEHAQEINAIARAALRVETRDATFTARKISIGLSLQAAELAGKSILRSLGETAQAIRARHQRHDVLTLLRDAENRLRTRTEVALISHHDFLSWTPHINGQPFRTTIANYLQAHFARGVSAKPRNYFYPDVPTFTAPVPVQSLLIMVDHLIAVASDVSTALEPP